jgi:hypothetical protein
MWLKGNGARIDADDAFVTACQYDNLHVAKWLYSTYKIRVDDDVRNLIYDNPRRRIISDSQRKMHDWLYSL